MDEIVKSEVSNSQTDAGMYTFYFEKLDVWQNARLLVYDIYDYISFSRI